MPFQLLYRAYVTWYILPAFPVTVQVQCSVLVQLLYRSNVPCHSSYCTGPMFSSISYCTGAVFPAIPVTVQVQCYTITSTCHSSYCTDPMLHCYLPFQSLHKSNVTCHCSYCAEHARRTVLLRQRASTKRRLPETPETLLHELELAYQGGGGDGKRQRGPESLASKILGM